MGIHRIASPGPETWTSPKGGKQIPVTSLPLIFLEQEVIANCFPYLRRRRTGSKNGIINDHYYLVFRENISRLRCSQWHSSDSWGKWGLSKVETAVKPSLEAHVLVAPPHGRNVEWGPPKTNITVTQACHKNPASTSRLEGMKLVKGWDVRFGGPRSISYDSIFATENGT
jgi:hypothetical protein